ncbi:hypothetical protein EYF80_053960 [Liparis tanakae]|uniref:Uncharacterized protein n=1 Tax=Liparis tanakae TaxID=230148 RepID=A0A4Z2F468_9TELE|nr:hypothetical protein EYF80_053960 [Liparis tanakae]
MVSAGFRRGLGPCTVRKQTRLLGPLIRCSPLAFSKSPTPPVGTKRSSVQPLVLKIEITQVVAVPPSALKETSLILSKKCYYV